MARQVNLKSFGAAGSKSYFFHNVVRATTNFGKVDSKVTPLTGFDGGIDEFGTGYAPRASGQVTVDFWLLATNEDEMTALRDAVSQLPFWGVRELLITPYNETEPDRWCYARCVNVSMPEDAGTMTQLSQPVSLNFEVANPLWYSRQDTVWIGQDFLIIDSPTGWSIIGEQFSQPSENSMDISLQYNGKAPTPITLEFDAVGGTWFIGDAGVDIGDPDLYIGGFGGFSDVNVKHYDADNLLLEEWTWDGALFNNGEHLVIDSGALSVKKQTSVGELSAWPEFTINKGTGFIRLYPGLNRLLITGTFAGGTTRIFYNDTWT